MWWPLEHTPHLWAVLADREFDMRVVGTTCCRAVLNLSYTSITVLLTETPILLSYCYHSFYYNTYYSLIVGHNGYSRYTEFLFIVQQFFFNSATKIKVFLYHLPPSIRRTEIIAWLLDFWKRKNSKCFLECVYLKVEFRLLQISWLSATLVSKPVLWT